MVDLKKKKKKKKYGNKSLPNLRHSIAYDIKSWRQKVDSGRQDLLELSNGRGKRTTSIAVVSTEHDTCSFMWNVTHKPFALAMSLQPNASRHSAGRVCDLMAFWPAGCPIVAYMLNNNRGSVASFSVDSVVCHFGLEQLSQFWVHSLQGQEFVDAKENVCMSQIKKKRIDLQICFSSFSFLPLHARCFIRLE